MGDVLGSLAKFSVEVVHSAGYVGLALLSALSNLMLPLPSEIFLPLAGFLVGEGKFAFLGVLACSTFGAVVGSSGLYWLGRRLGERRLRKFIRRFGRYLLIKESNFEHALRWFHRHESATVTFGRLLPGVGALISLPAGVSRMSLGRFVFFTAIGCALWNTVLVSLGWALGSHWKAVGHYESFVRYPLLFVLICVGIWFFWRHRRV